MDREAYQTSLFEAKKAYLGSYKKIARKIQDIEIQLAELREDAKSAKSLKIDGMPHGHYPRGLDEYIVQVEAQIERLTKRKQDFHEAKGKLLLYISNLEKETHRELLRLRYLTLKQSALEKKNKLTGTRSYTMEELTEIMDYAEPRHLYRLMNAAINALPDPPQKYLIQYGLMPDMSETGGETDAK